MSIQDRMASLLSEGSLQCKNCGTEFSSQAAADKAACCEEPQVEELWPISKADVPAGTRVTNQSHEAAMRKAGWVSSKDRPDAFKVGDKVLQSMSNGYEGWRTVKGFYKGGGVRLLTPEGRTLPAGHLAWKKESDIKESLRTVQDRMSKLLREQDSQRVQQYAAQASAAAAVAPSKKARQTLSKMADYWGHEGDALAHAERLTKDKRKKRK